MFLLELRSYLTHDCYGVYTSSDSQWGSDRESPRCIHLIAIHGDFVSLLGLSADGISIEQLKI